MIRIVSRWLLVFVPLFLANCSASFNREWDEARAAAPHGPYQDITGAWVGTWRSDAGHHGELRCVVSHEDAKSADYRFHYHAVFGGILSAAYVVTEQVQRQGPHFTLRGDHDLGAIAGGTYHYEGTATVAQMKSTYRSSEDHGVFELARP